MNDPTHEPSPGEAEGDDANDAHGGSDDPWSEPGPGPTGGWSAEADPRVQAGLDHLQRAAREVITASRALLDVAEELVEDPKAAAGLADLLGSVGTMAARFRPPAGATQRPGADGFDDDDDPDPPVQRIPVS